MATKDRLGDRRRDLRFEIIGQLWGSLETVEPLPLRNVARGGALVESRLPLASETVHNVRLAYEAHTTTIAARVCHVTPIVSPDGTERYLVGLQFLEPDSAAIEQIDNLVTASGGHPAPRMGA
jgi:hypothetical protein